MAGELEKRSGIKEEGFKEKNEVNNWLAEAESWTIELNCQLPVKAKCMTVLLGFTNWPVETKCLTLILSSYISVIREYTAQFSAYMSSTPITAFPSPALTFMLKFLV